MAETAASLLATVETEIRARGAEGARDALLSVQAAGAKMEGSLLAAVGQLDAGEGALKALKTAGVSTTGSILAQVNALDRLKDAAGDDVVALKQIEQQQKALRGALAPTNDAMAGQSQASHRASLFMLNFSRAAEDLKFGLPAVINNLDAVGFSFSLLRRDADQANLKLKDVLKQSLGTGAGMLAAFNVAYTGLFLLKGLLDKTAKSTEDLSDAVSDLVRISSEFKGFDFDAGNATAASKAVIVDLQEISAAATRASRDISIYGVGTGGAVNPVNLLSGAQRDAVEANRLLRDAFKDQLSEVERAESVYKRLVDLGITPVSTESEAVREVSAVLEGQLGNLGIKIDTTTDKWRDLAVELEKVRDLQREAFRTRAIESDQGNVELEDIEIDIPAELSTREQEMRDFAKATRLANREADLLQRGLTEDGTIAVSDYQAEVKRLSDKIRDAYSEGFGASSSLVKELRAEISATENTIASLLSLASDAAGISVDPFEESSLDDILGTDGQIAADLERTVAGLERVETSADRVADAFRDRLAAEVEGVATSIEEFPIDAIDALTSSLSESAVDLVTLQSSFKDFGEDVLDILKRQAVEMLALIAKQRILNALKAQGAATGGLGLLGSINPLLGIGAALVGGVALSNKFSGSGGSDGGTWKVTVDNSFRRLPSGDIAVANNRGSQVNTRLRR